MSNRPRILIALSTAALSNYIYQILHQSLGNRIEYFTCDDAYGIYDKLRGLRPDIIIVSTNIIGSGFLKYIREQFNLERTKFIAFCFSHLDENVIRGFDGKLNISDSPSEIIETVDKLLETQQQSQEELAEQALTPREKEIVVGVVKGLTNKEIASDLNLSTHTVITHRRNIAKKLSIHSPAGLTIYAIVNKLVELKDLK